MTSVLNVDTIADKAGTGPVGLTKQQAAKLYSYYTQSTPAVTGSFGVSSVSDDSTGRYTISFTNSFSNANYSTGGMASLDGDPNARFNMTYETKATGTVKMNTFNISSADEYKDGLSDAQLLGDLA